MHLQVQASSTIWRETSIQEGRDGEESLGRHKEEKQQTSQGSYTVTRNQIIPCYHGDRSDLIDSWKGLGRESLEEEKGLKAFEHIVIESSMISHCVVILLPSKKQHVVLTLL